MVLCWIALPILAFMGIFSVKYRRLTVESFDCLFRSMTFRKCRSGLDERIKSDLTGKMMKISPGLARGFYKNYKLISIIFLILLIVSSYFSAVGIYNYVKYGNCNGEDSKDFCIIDSIGEGLNGESYDEHGTLDGVGCVDK